MWLKLSSLIIKFRVFLVLTIALFTGYMAWEGRNIELAYDYVRALPESDPEFQYYKSFIKTFGEDGNIIAVSMKDNKALEIDNFKKLGLLTDSLEKVQGIKSVISLTKMQKLAKDTAEKRFVLQPVFTKMPDTQQELDSLIKVAKNVKMYEGLFINDTSNAMVVAVYVDDKILNTFDRQYTVAEVTRLCNSFSATTGIKLHFAGLPYIRSTLVGEVQREFKMFLGLSALVTCIVLFLFFRSFKAVAFAILIIAITVVWTMGTLGVLEYKMNLLTGMLPALIVVMSIPNCVYMINQYHQEIKKHGNKIRGVSRIIQKVGFLTFMTNINSAVGFFVLLTTDIIIVREFGIVAGICSVAAFIISIIVIPSLLLFLPVPSQKQLAHLDIETLTIVNHWVKEIALNHRRWVYGVFGTLLLISIYGITRIQTIAFMVDDLPSKSNIKKDLAFFEENFRGVMPLEIIINVKDRNAITKLSTLRQIEELDNYLKTEPFVSTPLSILNLIKGATQTFYNDSPENYRLPSNMEKSFILKYFASSKGQKQMLKSFIDSTGKQIRMTTKVKDIGTIGMDSLVNQKILPKIKEIFGEKADDVKITGTTLLYLKGTKYLIDDLYGSLLIAFILISLMMAFIFTDIKMIIISIIPNLVPMIMTAGVMGLLDIHLKTSTALIFSISFGISIDNTIHFLSKYKQELFLLKGNVRLAIVETIKDSSVSMIYTSLVLFAGFGIFMLSDFGGTQALGLLTAMTLFFALFTNMVLLPTLILAWDKKVHIVEEDEL